MQNPLKYHSEKKQTNNTLEATRIEFNCVLYNTKEEKTLIVLPNGNWRLQYKDSYLEGHTSEATIASILRLIDSSSEVEEQESYCPSTSIVKGVWYVRIYFDNVLIKRLTGPLLPSYISRYSAIDILIQERLGIDTNIFTASKLS